MIELKGVRKCGGRQDVWGDNNYHGDNAGCLGGDHGRFGFAGAAEDFSSRMRDLEEKGGKGWGGGEEEKQ